MNIDRLIVAMRNIFLVLMLLSQPIFVSALIVPLPARAQDETGNGEELTDDEDADLLANFQTSADIPPQPADFLPQSFYDLQLFDKAQGRLVIAPEDQQALEDGKIDIRVSDYLMKLVLPEELGGYNIDHIKVARLQKNYTSDGNGKMDREGADSNDEGGGTVSTHNKGQALDISEVGTVTCKLVYKRHLGGNTTKWQKPKPVKVAWQSTEGINNNPTPTAQSLIGAAGDMTAQGILNYLNESGEMDYYVDYVRSLEPRTIIAYVGANIYLKTFGVNQVLSDPLADGLLHVLGGAVLEKNLPGLPPGFSAGNNEDDARVSFAKTRIEQGFNLPSGSLKGYGWDNILQGVGKRHLETSMGLPTNYFDKHTLDEALKKDGVKTALDYLKRSDDGFNLMVGTVEKLKAKDERGFKMAGVSILSDAFRLTPVKQEALEKAVVDGKAPDISLEGVPTGNNVSSDTLKAMFSADKNKQKEAEAELKSIGLVIVQQAAKGAIKGKYAGVTSKILEDLLNSKQVVTLGNVKERAGGGTMGLQAGAKTTTPDNKKLDIGRYISQNADQIATFLNTELGLKDNQYRVTSTDVNGILDGKSYTIVEKMGSAEVDKAFGWNNGTTYELITNKKNWKTAVEESFSNFVGTTLGLRDTGVSLEGNIPTNYGYAIISERMGIDEDKLRANEEIRTLFYGANSIGPGDGYRIFKVFSSKTMTELYEDEGFWEEELNTVNWKAMDIVLGVALGTTRSYIRGQLTTAQFAKKIGQANMANLTTDKIYDHFGIDDQFRLSGDDIKNLLNVFSGKEEHQTLDNIEAAKTSIYRILGRSVDGKADYSKDTFFAYIVAPDGAKASKLLLDQGLRMFAQSLGVNLDGYGFDDFQYVADLFKAAFGRGELSEAYGTDIKELESLRQEYDRLKDIAPDQLTAEQSARLNELEHHNPLKRYLSTTNNLTDFMLNATGIPKEFRVDAQALIRGDYRTAIAAASFAATLPQVNKYLPEDGKITYAEFRSTLILDSDFPLLQMRMDQIAEEQGLTSLTEEQNDEIRAQAQTEIDGSPSLKNSLRRQVLDDNRRNVEYHMADSLLRKSDPNIPVGFARAMFSGNNKLRGQALQGWAFNHLDQYLVAASPLYVPGTLQAIYEGGLTNAEQDALILNIINRQGISFGPFSTNFVSNFYQFIRSSNKQGFYTEDRYQGMWSFFDGWVAENLGIGDIPVGIAKSIYYASEHGWSIDARFVKDGKTLVPSLNDLGKDLLISRLSDWGDKKFGFQAGTVYKTYKLVNDMVKANGLLTAAHATDLKNGLDVAHGAQSAQTASASKSFSQTRAALIMFAIELALSMCKQCQEFFGNVDRALAAPPGFTQALVTGIIAQALGLGPAGIYIAVAIYLFGVYDVQYLCPKPALDIYALEEFDPPQDKNDFGIGLDSLPDNLSGSPPPGSSVGDKFAWGDQRPFTDGNKPRLWMGWARFYVGKLVDTSLQYGEARQSPWKPQQLLTYRRANAEFFAPRVVSAFGTGALDIPYVGLGYSQTTTKTTDWIHVSFGGAF